MIEKFTENYVPEPNTGCWLWIGRQKSTGYGRMSFRGKTLAAHRVSYELHRGPIPEGTEIDHLCRVRWCVNPDHLQAVSHRENCLRSAAVMANLARSAERERRKTHCPSGHAYDEANTIVSRSNKRNCRLCKWLRS